MSTVFITKFSEDKTKFNWTHNSNSGEDVSISTLNHGKNYDNNDDKAILVVEDSVDGSKSFYPMSGGLIAQQLHQYHLDTDTLENVQLDAEDRDIDIEGKTKAELIVEIIQDECSMKNAPYLL